MDRKFGIELEIAGITRQVALRALRAVGINVQELQPYDARALEAGFGQLRA